MATKSDFSGVPRLDSVFAVFVMPWRRGVLVTAAPEIFYDEDSDGAGCSEQSGESAEEIQFIFSHDIYSE